MMQRASKLCTTPRHLGPSSTPSSRPSEMSFRSSPRCRSRSSQSTYLSPAESTSTMCVLSVLRHLHIPHERAGSRNPDGGQRCTVPAQPQRNVHYERARAVSGGLGRGCVVRGPAVQGDPRHSWARANDNTDRSHSATSPTTRPPSSPPILRARRSRSGQLKPFSTGRPSFLML